MAGIVRFRCWDFFGDDMFKVGDEVVFYGESLPDCPHVEGSVYIIKAVLGHGEGYIIVEGGGWYALPQELVKLTKLHRALK